VTYSKSGLEVTSNTTVAGLADCLASLDSSQQSQMTKELVHVLRSVKSPQWRTSTGLGDALAHNKEVQGALLASGAKAVVTLANGDKTLELSDVLDNIHSLTISTLLLPSQAQKSFLLFSRIGSRKANASGITCAALDATLDGQIITTCKISSPRPVVRCLLLYRELLRGKT